MAGGPNSGPHAWKPRPSPRPVFTNIYAIGIYSINRPTLIESEISMMVLQAWPIPCSKTAKSMSMSKVYLFTNKAERQTKRHRYIPYTVKTKSYTQA